jgi:hypothetical protein
MEATLVLATIMQRCHLALTPGQEIEPEPLVTLRPCDGVWMEIGVRDDFVGAFRETPLPERDFSAP